MDFLKPYQGPGRSNNGIILQKDEDETECDLGFQVLAKATSNSTDEDVKQTTLGNSTSNLFASSLANVLPNFVGGAGIFTSTSSSSSLGLTTATSGTNGFSTTGPLVLPVPSLPTVQLPPSLTAKPILSGMPNASCATNGISISSQSSSHSTTTTTNSSTSQISSSLSSLTAATPSSLASQIFALPQLSAKGPIPMPANNTASSVGCLIIEPQLFASADTFKKEFGNVSSGSTSSANSCITSTTSKTQITPSNLSIYPNINAQVTPVSAAASMANATNLLNPPMITKIRRVQPSPHHQTPTAINLSYNSTAPVVSSACLSLPSSLSYTGPNGFFSTAPNLLPNNFTTNFAANLTPVSNTVTTTTLNGPSPAKRLKTAELEISAILQANRDLDANTLFFLSLARSVRSMPTKFQSLAKMRCMRIVSDIELELDNVNCDGSDVNSPNNNKYCTNNTDSPPSAIGSHINEPPQSEHFVYVMSPSRVEGMIDLSSDDENTQSVNSGANSSCGVGGTTAASGNGIIGQSN
ncbi:uncharacterized protein LOC142239435 isoform X2 [Haematobia irritans]